MITTHTLSPAQAAVLSGPIEFNANGSTAVTTGRENTLASLRRAGFLAGNLLTGNGRNARHSIEGGNRKVTASENGAAVSYVKAVTEDVRADWETELATTGTVAAPVAPTMCQDCETRPATIFDTDAPMCAECAGGAPAREFKIHFGYSSELPGGVQCGANNDTPYGSACTLTLANVTCDACRTAHTENNPLARAARDAADAPADVVPDAFDDAAHVIKFMGNDVTMCGELVRGKFTTLRVSIDPTDATCAQCTVAERALAALDAIQPEDDEADHAAALSAALEAAERHLTPAQATAARVHGINPANVRKGGVVQIPGLPEGTTVPLPPVVRVEREGRFLVATLAGLGEVTFRTANGPQARMRVEMWARSNGVRPSAKGWKWIEDGGVLVAPVSLV